MCPTPADTVTLYNCTTADGVGEMVISSEDDSIVLTNADGTVHGGTSVWGEGDTLPFGLYFINHAGLVISDGYQLWTYQARFGDTSGSELGLYANLTPDQPNAQLDFVMVPIQTDSDGDGASDDAEIDFGSDPYDPASFPFVQAGGPDPDYDTDTDGDGLTDFEDVEVYGSDPYSTDSDGDGDVDPSEIAYGSNPLDPADFPPGNAGYPAGDSDGDALTDAEEIEIYGTDPNSSDTDGDGASDYDEVWAGNDPLVSGISPAGEEGATSAASPSPAPSTSGKAAVTQLPNTGAGLDTEDSASMTGILGVLAAAAMAFGGLVANRRRA